MTYYSIILFCLIISIASEERDGPVECLSKDFTSSQIHTMTLTEQESLVQKILNEYNQNLTTLAYITSSAEFESSLFLNDTTRKRTTEKYYDIYRGCLKTISLIGGQFKNLIHHPNSSVSWLLLRTQAIGEAGENNTMMRAELQKLRGRIKEVYHRKFIWNNTKIGIDEIQEILGKLNSSDDLLSLWNSTYQVAAPMRDHYATLIALQNQQAKQNRTSAVTHSHI